MECVEYDKKKCDKNAINSLLNAIKESKNKENNLMCIDNSDFTNKSDKTNQILNRKSSGFEEINPLIKLSEELSELTKLTEINKFKINNENNWKFIKYNNCNIQRQSSGIAENYPDENDIKYFQPGQSNESTCLKTVYENGNIEMNDYNDDVFLCENQHDSSYFINIYIYRY